MDSFLNPEDLCKQACLSDISRYIKIKNDFEVVKSSLIEVINNLTGHGCYTSLVPEEQQTIILDNLTAVQSVSLQ